MGQGKQNAYLICFGVRAMCAGNVVPYDQLPVNSYTIGHFDYGVILLLRPESYLFFFLFKFMIKAKLK